MKLARNEAIDEGLTRIANHAIARAAAHLTDVSMDPVARVHETRKRCKEVRAILRLGRDALDGDFASLNATFRDVAHQLAPAREAAVLLSTIKSLRAAAENPDEWRALTQVSRFIARQPLPQVGLERLAEQLPSVSFSAEGTGWFRRGLRRTYRNGRRALRHARVKPNADAIHEWRKRVKDLSYAVQIVSPVAPDMREAHAKLDDLAHLLGDHHDVWSLDAFVAENHSRCGAAAAVRVSAVAARRLSALESKIFDRGAAAYADPSRDWSRRVITSWRDWTRADVM